MLIQLLLNKVHCEQQPVLLQQLIIFGLIPLSAGDLLLAEELIALDMTLPSLAS